MINQWKQTLVQTSKKFDRSQAHLFDTLGTPEHFTVVVHPPSSLKNEMASFSNILHAQDPSLLMVDPEKYHITLVAVPLSVEVEQLQKLVRQALQAKDVSLELFGVFLDPLVIAIGALPAGQELYELRRKILQPLNIPMPAGLRAQIGWSSLAHFAQLPSQPMINTALGRVSYTWGRIQVNTATIYRTSNKHLDGAIPVGTIVLK